MHARYMSRSPAELEAAKLEHEAELITLQRQAFDRQGPEIIAWSLIGTGGLVVVASITGIMSPEVGVLGGMACVGGLIWRYIIRTELRRIHEQQIASFVALQAINEQLLER